MSSFTPPYFNPLTIPFLPDTYFPYSKRSLNHRPYCPEVDSDSTKVLKRLRSGPCPVEHFELAAIMNLEREKIRTEMSRLFQTHETSMVHMPGHVLKFLQSQGVTLNRTNEALEVLITQASELADSLAFAIEKLKKKQEENFESRLLNVDSTLLVSCYDAVSEALENIRQFRQTEPRNSSNPQFSSASQYKVICTALEGISKIRDVLMIQCENASGNLSCNYSVNCSITPAPVTLIENQRLTWDEAYAAVQRLEVYLRAYMECLGIFPNTSGQVPSDSGTYMSVESVIASPTPCFASTPINHCQSTIKSILKKRKSEDVSADMCNDLESSSLSESGRIRGSTEKRIRFSFEEDASMEVDD